MKLKQELPQESRESSTRRFKLRPPKNPVITAGLIIAPVVMAATSLKNAVALSLTLAIVTIPTSVVAGIIRKTFSKWVRFAVYAGVAALLLIPATAVVKKTSANIFDSIGIYFALMAMNSLIFSRAEKFAVKAGVLGALLDSLLNCAGFAAVAGFVAAIRELLGNNTLWGLPVAFPFKLPSALLPFFGFIIIAFIAAGYRYFKYLVSLTAEKLDRLFNPEDEEAEVRL